MNIQPVAKIQFCRFDKRFSLKLLTEGNDLGKRHSRPDMKTILGDDWTLVQTHGNEMGCHPHNLDPALVSLAVRLRTGEARQ